MIVSTLYFILALFCLSFLIFIHELGHYWMARRVGMRVETFAIGFGKPIYCWVRDGVKWQIGWLFFGGYVKIVGQDPDDDRNPYDIPDGFFGKSPWARIKVAFAGPFMNLLLAMVLFAALWGLGGRQKNYSEFTPKIGWVDPNSELYNKGVRPGDEVVGYDDHLFTGFKDHIFSPMTAKNNIDITINKVDYVKGDKEENKYNVKVYQHPSALENGIKTAGITQSASYIIYDKFSNDVDNPLPEGSPMEGSGIQIGDRIVWVDGHSVYSLTQLNNILNDDRVFATIEREGVKLERRVPRVLTQELRLDNDYREELIDWQYEADLNQVKFRNLYTIPYDLTNNAVIEKKIAFIDKENEKEAFPEHPFSELEEPLLPGDHIIAINGAPVTRSYTLINLLQKRRANIVVLRGAETATPLPWNEMESGFEKQINWADLEKIGNSIGTGSPIKNIGNLYLLETVTPKKIQDFPLSAEAQASRTKALAERRKIIEEIDDPDRRAYALNLLENQENQLVLGLPGIQDRKVQYNPNPIETFTGIVNEIGRTLYALFTGNLNPKWMSGPVGIIHMVHDNSMVSIKEAIFWMGLISLNLGILNLLPIPVLDGGTIVFSFYELVTRKRIHPKTMEKLVIPFAILLITFFIFLTYNDIMRIFSGFWR